MTIQPKDPHVTFTKHGVQKSMAGLERHSTNGMNHAKCRVVRTIAAIAFLGLRAASVFAAEMPRTPPATANPAEAAIDQSEERAGRKQFEEQVRPFLARHCLECHGAEKPKGDLRLDALTPDFADQVSREKWLAVRERAKSGEMPPKAKPRPPEKEVHTLADWISAGVHAADTNQRATEGRVVLRRLNRVEYENTVRDLLGIYVELKAMLPPIARHMVLTTSARRCTCRRSRWKNIWKRPTRPSTWRSPTDPSPRRSSSNAIA